MNEMKLSPSLIAQLEEIYESMEREYDKVATALNFSCDGCPDNCCDSYFQHHTYIEWCYLWLGLQRLPEEKQKDIVARSQEYIVKAEKALHWWLAANMLFDEFGRIFDDLTSG